VDVLPVPARVGVIVGRRSSPGRPAPLSARRGKTEPRHHSCKKQAIPLTNKGTGTARRSTRLERCLELDFRWVAGPLALLTVRTRLK
jgi:hypothetical protein